MSSQAPGDISLSASAKFTPTGQLRSLHHPLPPSSPPLSTTASQVDAFSPQLSSLTPPASVPMSADPSQQTQYTPSHRSTLAHSLLPTGSQIDRDGDSLMGDNGSSSERPSSKRKFEEDDSTDHDSKRLRSGESLPSQADITALRQHTFEPSPLYKLCSSPHEVSRPHPTQDLMSLYNLNTIARSVARRDEKTGEKINKLRKSYAGKTKGILGSNEATKIENEFMNLLLFPDDEYHNQRARGKELASASPAAFKGKLDRAVQLSAQSLPRSEDDKWKKYISWPDTKSIPQQAVGLPSLPKTGPNSAVSSPAPLIARPLRRGTKRRYDDDSFEGYNESYADAPEDGGPMDGDEDDDRTGSIKRRRKRDAAGSPPFASSMNQYSTPAVSVGSGSYTPR